MPDPISTDDLYGPSDPPVPEGVGSPSVPLPIEETPEIPMDMPAAPPPPSATVPAVPAVSAWAPVQPPPKPSSLWSTVGTVILFIGLFGLGVLMSDYIRVHYPNGLNGIVGITKEQQQLAIAPTPTPDPYATWKTYQVLSSTTKLPIDGITFKLPGDVLAPSCDTTTCLSQGTYLTGGTRFTITPRGQGQLLADFRGSAISDVAGDIFTTKTATVSGHEATVFTGSFGGKTAGGYGFTQMRGYMIEVTPTLSLEVNHFVPDGVTADFAKDDVLFDQIVSTIVMPGAAPSALTPGISLAPIATHAATSATAAAASGY